MHPAQQSGVTRRQHSAHPMARRRIRSLEGMRKKAKQKRKLVITPVNVNRNRTQILWHANRFSSSSKRAPDKTLTFIRSWPVARLRPTPPGNFGLAQAVVRRFELGQDQCKRSW